MFAQRPPDHGREVAFPDCCIVRSQYISYARSSIATTCLHSLCDLFILVSSIHQLRLPALVDMRYLRHILAHILGTYDAVLISILRSPLLGRAPFSAMVPILSIAAWIPFATVIHLHRACSRLQTCLCRSRCSVSSLSTTHILLAFGRQQSSAANSKRHSIVVVVAVALPLNLIGSASTVIPAAWSSSVFFGLLGPALLHRVCALPCVWYSGRYDCKNTAFDVLAQRIAELGRRRKRFLHRGPFLLRFRTSRFSYDFHLDLYFATKRIPRNRSDHTGVSSSHFLRYHTKGRSSTMYALLQATKHSIKPRREDLRLSQFYITGFVARRDTYALRDRVCHAGSTYSLGRSIQNLYMMCLLRLNGRHNAALARTDYQHTLTLSEKNAALLLLTSSLSLDSHLRGFLSFFYTKLERDPRKIFYHHQFMSLSLLAFALSVVADYSFADLRLADSRWMTRDRRIMSLLHDVH